MIEIYTSKDCPFNYYGFLTYRIEIDLTNNHVPLQRHIWTKNDGSKREDEWVPTGLNQTKDKLLKEGWKLCNDNQ